jgi:hypothetical protein
MVNHLNFDGEALPFHKSDKPRSNGPVGRQSPVRLSSAQTEIQSKNENLAAPAYGAGTFWNAGAALW